MAYRCFEVEVENKVGHLRFCRPDELNSMVVEFWRELPEIVDRQALQRRDGSVGLHLGGTVCRR